MQKKHKAKLVRKKTAIKALNSGLKKTLENIMPTFFEEVDLGGFITKPEPESEQALEKKKQILQEYNQQIVLINDPAYSGIKIAIGKIEINENETDSEHYLFHALGNEYSNEILAYKNLKKLFAC